MSLITVLPDDLLCLILRYLNIRSIFNLRCVCQLFYDILKNSIAPEEVTLRVSSFFKKSDTTCVSGVASIEIIGGKSQNEFVLFSPVLFNKRSPFTIANETADIKNDKGRIIFRRSSYQPIMKVRIVSGYYDIATNTTDTWGGQLTFDILSVFGVETDFRIIKKTFGLRYEYDLQKDEGAILHSNQIH